MLKILLVACVAAGVSAEAAERVWTPQTFGAKADGVTLDTRAVQAAVDAAAAAGGGTVRLAEGIYLSGTLMLKSGVTLRIDGSAVLRGSADIADYPSITPQADFLYRTRFTKSLIYAERQTGIGLEGQGVIDGQGTLFPARKGDDGGRPYLIRFSECTNVAVRGVALVNSARWCSHVLACSGVTIERVTIRNRIRENRDGLDIDSCDGVRIRDCDIYSGDDAIVLKSTVFGRPCRDVKVWDCRLSGAPSCLKLGTESQGGFEDIEFRDCFCYDARDGICVEEVDGGVCRNVAVSNIVLRNVETPIFIRLGNRANPIPGHDKPDMGKMREIEVAHIRAEGAGALGCSVTGIPGHPVEGVTLRDIRIRFAGCGTDGDGARQIPEREASYPKGTMFGTLPAYGFFVRHVNGLKMADISMAFDGQEARPAMILDDVSGFEASGFDAQVQAGVEKIVTR
jgi:polygalacturonase